MGSIINHLPYYIPYNISDHVKPIVLVANTNGRSYSAVEIDFDDDEGVQSYSRNLERIEYVCTSTGTHTMRLTAYHSGGADVQLATIKIFDDFEPYDNQTFFDYISATKNDYSLPNSKYSLVGSNDWVTADNINAAFKSVYENLEYLEELCHRPDFRGKETILSWLGGSDLEWVQYDYGFLGDFNNDFISTFGNQLLEITSGNLDYLSAVGFTELIDIALKDDGQGSNLYLIDSTKVVALSSDDSATLILSSANIQFNKTFVSPNSIDVDSLNNIYVADPGNNEVYKFRAINGTLLLQTSVGGVGLSGDKYRLTAPNQVRIDSKDRIIISDRDNYCIKIYDNLMSWIQTIEVGQGHGKVLALAIDKRDDTIYAVTELRYLKKYTSSGTLISTVLLPSISPNIRQCFVEYNSNFLYIVCTGVVFKYTREGLFLKTMAVPENNAQPANEATSGRSDEHNQTFITTRSKVFRIDSTPPILSIKPYTQNLYYEFEEIKIHPKEGVEDWVYNKALYRLIHNHIVFARNIFSTFVRGVNTNNVLESFTLGSRDFSEVLTFVMSDDLYVGMNEPVLVNVVNRALGALHDFQEQALDSIAPEIRTLYTIIPSLDNDLVYIPTPTPTPTPTSSSVTPTPTPTVTVTPPTNTFVIFYSNSLGNTSTTEGTVQVLCFDINFNSYTTVPYGAALSIPVGSIAHLKAVPNSGYHFKKWSMHTQYLITTDYTQEMQTLQQPGFSIALVAEFEAD